MSDRSLVGRVARLVRALRERGVRVGLSDEIDAVEALTRIDLSDREEVRLALSIALKIRHRDREIFDELFARYFSASKLTELEPPSRQRRPRGKAAVRLTARPPEAPGDQRPEAERPEGERPGYSPEVQLRRKSFEECGADELAAMERLLARLALNLATRRSRRLVPVRGRGVVHLRRSLRRMVATGGEPLLLPRRAPAVEQPRLVVLCDTSGSMEPHTRFLLAFVLALRRVTRRTEMFAFNTALTRLTPWIAPGKVGATLGRLAAGVPDWSGGTRIGECLADFVEHYLDETVDGRTVVLILSDGLDRGELEPLAAAMKAIRSRARKVFWLNPLMGDPRYRPTARAMAQALPFVDRLVPAHNLESLERLLPLLAA